MYRLYYRLFRSAYLQFPDTVLGSQHEFSVSQGMNIAVLIATGSQFVALWPC